MSIVRVGTTKRYADGWDAIFRKKSATAQKAAPAAKKAGKKTARRKK